MKVTYALLGSIILLALVSCDNREKRNVYLIPENFVGWVCVTFGADGTALQKDAEGFQLVQIPASGILTTSTPGQPGVGYRDDFYFYSGSGDRKAIPGSAIGGGGTYAKKEWPQERYTYFFWIGEDRSKFKLAVDPKAAAEGPKCGPV